MLSSKAERVPRRLMDNPSQFPDLSTAVLAERTHLRIPSRPELVPPLVELLKHKAQLCGACHESRTGKLVLALHEALTNAVVHGNLELSSDLKERDDGTFARALAERAANPHYADRSVHIDVDHDMGRCRWSITDVGRGFDFTRYLGREPDPESLFVASGRGILLMRAFVDEVAYEQNGRKVTLTLYHASGIEKRQEAREPLRQSVQVTPVRPDGSIDWKAASNAVVQNLSPSGMSLLQSKLANSNRVILGVEIEGEMIYLPAEVRRSRPIGDGVVELGCCFLPEGAPLPAGECPAVEGAVEQVLYRRRTVPPSAEERRSQPREAYTERIEVTGPPGTASVTGFARDLSKGGIAFISMAPLPLEPRVICLPQGSGGILRLQARIVRCIELTPGFYDVGASFVSLEP
jgi:anti-sigma regulatory factor (Ser/Thr protein kinase)